LGKDELMASPDDGFSVHSIIDGAIVALGGIVAWLGKEKFDTMKSEIAAKASRDVVENIEQTLIGHINETREWRKENVARLDRILERLVK
jgi:hypothetical protein